MINARDFDNNSSTGYDSTCDNPAYHYGAFIEMNNTSRKKVTVPNMFPKDSNYYKNVALRNAAFRVWVLVKDINGTKVRVDVDCKSRKDAQCFKVLYNREYAKSDKYCKDSCNSGVDDQCYQCLRVYHSIPICSRDNFAIKPYTYNIDLYDNNETSNSDSIKIGDNFIPRINHIAAGYKYEIKSKAIAYGDNNITARGYNFLDAIKSNLKTSQATYQYSGTDCNDTTNKDVNIVIFNGESTKQYYDENDKSKFDNTLLLDNVGKYKFAIIDKEWTLVDQKDYSYKPFPNIADCQLNSVDPKASSKQGVLRGCDIRSNMNPRVDLTIVSHPYKFDINSINMLSNPNSSANYLYVADMNKIKNQTIDNSIMALNIKGLIKAIGKKGKELSNYKNGCMAKDLDIVFSYKTYPDKNIRTSFGNVVPLQYLLYDSFADTDAIVKSKTDINAQNSVSVIFNKRYFYDPGVGHFNTYLNVGRNYSATINPFNFITREFNVSSPTDKMNVDLKSNYIPKATKELNTTKTFYYAKVKSASDFYDDIYSNSINTPVEIAIFCNKELEYCFNFGIDIEKDSTNEYDWWLSREHNATFDGKALIEIDTSKDINASRNFKVTPQIVQSFINGVDSDVNISKNENANIDYPYTIFIKPTNNMNLNYPYLLFNRYDPNNPPNYLWKARFVKPSGQSWSGKGKSGYVTDINITGRRTKKIDW